MNAVLTPAELAEIEERVSNATPGPWELRDFTPGLKRHGQRVVGNVHRTPSGEPVRSTPVCTVANGFVTSDDDAQLIAAAPTDIRRLLSHVAALEGERDRLRAALTRAWSSWMEQFLDCVESLPSHAEHGLSRDDFRPMLDRLAAALSETPSNG